MTATELAEYLKIGTSMLAALLQVTETTLLSWDTPEPRNPAKKHRLDNLNRVVEMIVKLLPSINGQNVLTLLLNSDVVVSREEKARYEAMPSEERDDAWDGTYSLVDYISYPDRSELDVDNLEDVVKQVVDQWSHE